MTVLINFVVSFLWLIGVTLYIVFATEHTLKDILGGIAISSLMVLFLLTRNLSHLKNIVYLRLCRFFPSLRISYPKMTKAAITSIPFDQPNLSTRTTIPIKIKQAIINSASNFISTIYHKVKRAIGIMGLVLIPMGLLASPVLAIEPPDSTPTIENIKANVNLIESGDVLIYGEYNLPYASQPDVDASETYILSLIDTDGSTELGTVLPFVLFDGGYNKGAFGIYFSAADNLTLDEPYIIRISQNPAHFATPSTYNYVMPLSAYTSQTTQEANQTELAINIIATAQRIEDDHTGYTLLESSVGGTVLSDPTGETYFRGAIYGLQAMAPDLFLVQVLDIDTADREWSTTQFDTYMARFDGTWVGDATDNTSAQFGVTTPTLMGVIFLLPLCLGAIIVSSIKFKKAEPGFLASALILIMVALLGWMPTALFALIYQLMAIYIAYLWFYARGS